MAKKSETTDPKDDGNQNLTPPVTTEAATEDPRIAKKMAELDEALQRVNALNEKMEKQSKLLDENQEKVAALVAVSGKIAENVAEAHKGKAQRMKEHLAKQKKMGIFVPLEGKEKVGTLLPVTLNGYRVNIPKGRYVEVPIQVGKEVMNSLNQTVEAENIPQNLENNETKKDRLTL